MTEKRKRDAKADQDGPKTLAEYQRLFERFENYGDTLVFPDTHLIIRMDGRRYGAAWDKADIDYPYDKRVFDALVETAKALYDVGYKIYYSFIHGDEISLLFDLNESLNPRKRGRLVSGLASAAALNFAQALGLCVLFHTKLLELPSREHVADYFIWQRKVAMRNLTGALLSDRLKREGKSPQEINAEIGRLLLEERESLARERGLITDKTPGWILRGAGVIQKNGKFLVETKLPESDADYLKLLEEVI